MPHLNKEDLIIIQACFEHKNRRGAEICRQFREKRWNMRQVNRAIKKFEETGCIFWKTGRGRPTTACTNENRVEVEELALSQDDKPGSHKSQRKIASRLGVSVGSVNSMIKK